MRGEFVLDRAGLGEHAVGSGPAAVAVVEQDGLADAGELARAVRGRTCRSPARAARRRMRWAICRARTQVKTWTRMLCSVQWCIGRERDDAGVFHLPEGELGLGLGPVPGDDLGDGPVVVIGDQDVLAEDLLFQRGAGVRVDAPGQAQVLGLVAGQLPGDDPADPGLGGDRLDLGGDLVLAAAGLAAGQGGGQLVQLLAGLGQRGAVEPAGLGLRAVPGSGSRWRGARRRRPRGGCRRRSARRTGPYRRPIACWQAGRSGPGSRWRARTRCSAARCRPGARSWPRCSARRRRPRSCPRRRPGPGRGADRLVPAAQLGDHGRELGDVGLVCRGRRARSAGSRRPG